MTRTEAKEERVLMCARVADLANPAPGSRIERCRKCGEPVWAADSPLDAYECTPCVMASGAAEFEIRQEMLDRLRSLGWSPDAIMQGLEIGLEQMRRRVTKAHGGDAE